jgi:hypothetical protein
MRKAPIILLGYVLLSFFFTSCDKEELAQPTPSSDQEQFSGEQTNEVFPNQIEMIKALSSWVATSSAKDWLLAKRGVYNPYSYKQQTSLTNTTEKQ